MSFGLDQCSGQDGDAATDSQSSSSSSSSSIDLCTYIEQAKEGAEAVEDSLSAL
jgi:hypothetical protein